jgi:DNA-directed RNA polymerase subunit K/omega
VILRPTSIGAFEFTVLSVHRAAQLLRGCTPRVPAASRVTVTAQMEVAEGKVRRLEPPIPA